MEAPSPLKKTSIIQLTTRLYDSHSGVGGTLLGYAKLQQLCFIIELTGEVRIAALF